MARKFCQVLFSQFNYCQKRQFAQSHLPGDIPTRVFKKSIQYKNKSLSFNINTVKVGHGPQAVFFLPGILGCMEVQLMPQINHFDRDKFTIYAWDQPGYGQSRPPLRDFDNEALEQDAEFLVKIMKEFDHERWSLCGWSGGANIALLTAINNPDLINRIVVWGAFAQVRKEDAEIFKWFKDTEKWGGVMKETLIDYYGEEFFKENWHIWMDIFLSYHTERGGDFCTAENLRKIQCPTLIIHGQADKLIDPYHGNYLHQNIKNSKYYAWKGAKHNLHLRYPAEFKSLVEDFLCSSDPVPHQPQSVNQS